MIHSLCRLLHTSITCRPYQRYVDIKSINKVLVANRGEVAIRVLRACAELGIKTVAIYSNEDRLLSHKLKADESYLVGVGKDPVEAYMDIKEILKICRKAAVDAVHPGYKYLSETSDFAESVIKAGLRYIGPKTTVIDLLRNKVKTKNIAKFLNIPVVPGTESLNSLDEAQIFMKNVGLPMVVKPTFGSQGRGIRVIRDPGKLNATIEETILEAKRTVGSGSVFLEKYLPHVRIIEVQIVADMLGNVIHLFERDSSIQRKYMSMCEVAPAPNLPKNIRDELLAASIRMAKHIEFTDIGSFKFLIDENYNYYFLEADGVLTPDHSVTEEITGVDLVQMQIKIAEGRSIKRYINEGITTNCYAILCGITSEDPKQNFAVGTGALDIFRVGAGPGIRLDAAAGFAGANVAGDYDPLILNITARGKTLKLAARKMARTLKEFRVKGVHTNITFMINILENKNFQKGNISTSFLVTNPKLFDYKTVPKRSYLLIAYVAEVLVNGPSTPFYTNNRPNNIKPVIPVISSDPPSPGFRDLLKTKGRAAFLQIINNSKEALLTDTTFRDAHEALLMSRVRTYDLINIAPFLACNLNQLFALEMWGGTTFEVCLRYLHECPWRRLIRLRELIPNIPFQMVLRGASVVGYANYPDNVVYKFCEMAAGAGIDIFRIFDALNYLPNLKIGIDAVHNAGGIAEATIVYAGNIADPSRKKYPLSYYTELATQLVNYGADILSVKDCSGIMRPKAAEILVKALKGKFPDVPLHVHTHDTSGNGVSTSLAAILAGANIIDVAVDTMSGITSQPSMGGVVGALEDTHKQTKINAKAISAYAAYWEQTRTLYAPFECTSTMKSGNADVYHNEIPAPQYINLQFQAYNYGSGDSFEHIKKAYSEANMLLGDIVKTFPSAFVVADLAHFMLQNNLSSQDIIEKAEDLVFPSSVVSFFLGGLGIPYQGFPEQLRAKITKGLKAYEERPGSSLPAADFEYTKSELRSFFDYITDYDVMSATVFPESARHFFKFRAKYGPVDRLPTSIFLVGPQVGEDFFVSIDKGKSVGIKVLAVSSNQTHGRRQVFYELNGVLKVAYVLDKAAGVKVVLNPKAERGNKYQIGAPMRGAVAKINVATGDVVEKRFPLVVLHALKMETTIFCPFNGIVKDVHVSLGAELEKGDLIITLE